MGIGVTILALVACAVVGYALLEVLRVALRRRATGPDHAALFAQSPVPVQPVVPVRQFQSVQGGAQPRTTSSPLWPRTAVDEARDPSTGGR